MFAQNAIGFWSASASASYPACLDDANHWWYDATDLTTITKDGSNLVSVWAAKGGAKTGKNLLQATGTNQPLWVTPGTIRFDGVDDFLKSAAFTWDQPCYVYILVKLITKAFGAVILDGNISNYFRVAQSAVASYLTLYAGSQLNGSTLPLPENDWIIVKAKSDGATSALGIDTTGITGNAGTRNAGGITVGRRGNTDVNYGNIEVKDIVCVDIDDAANETEIYNWLVTRKP